MSLRRNRKRRAVKKAAKLWAGSKVASTAAKKAPKRPLALIGGALGLVALVAAVRKRRGGDSFEAYGPPNESVPSHETLAPAQQAAAAS